MNAEILSPINPIDSCAENETSQTPRRNPFLRYIVWYCMIIFEIGLDKFDFTSVTLSRDAEDITEVLIEEDDITVIEVIEEAVIEDDTTVEIEDAVIEDATMSKVTADDLMNFMSSFRESMEEKIHKTNVNLEEKIKHMDDKLDDRLHDLNIRMDDNVEKMELEIQKVSTKLDKNVDVVARMESRIDKLEVEMKKSEMIGRKTAELKNWHENLENQPAGSKRDEGTAKRKQFNRQRIESQDLINENNSGERFRSSWAKEVDEELRAAARMDGRSKDLEENTNEKTKEDDREEVWEVLKPRMKNKKVRLPVSEPTSWFGDEESTGTEGSSSDSDWTEIERKKHCEEKKKKMKLKKKMKIEETLTRARSMLGIGPVTKEMLENVDKAGKTKHMARKELVWGLLSHHLDYNTEELESLDIRETIEGKDDIVYFAASGMEMLREIYIRKAESRNDSLQIRNFIPPQLYKRYMYISGVCKDRRQENPDLKTQMRFGLKEIEVYTKYRGTGEGFKKVKLDEFLEMELLPEFEHDLKWKKRTEREERRKPNYRSTKPDENPTSRNKEQSMIRQRSVTDDKESKRMKHNEKISDIEMEDGSGSDDNVEYGTPAGGN